MDKIKFLAYVQYTTLYTCQAQLKHCNILSWLFIFLFFFPFIFPPSHPHQHSKNKGFILCKQKCVELKGILTLATALRGHVGTSVGGHEHLPAAGSLGENWVDGSGLGGHRSSSLVMMKLDFKGNFK